MIEGKKPDSLAAEDVANMLNKQPLEWISNVPTEADQFLLWIYKKGYDNTTKTRVEKYLKEKGLI